MTAKEFTDRLQLLKSDEELAKIQRYFKTGEGEYAEGDQFLGVRMGDVFKLAKEFIELPPEELELLLESPLHEVRAGALSIMDKQCRRKKFSEEDRAVLFDLYLRRIDRINNWDLVDLAAPWVVGRFLIDKPRDRLYELARSRNLWERRTAIVSTAYFIRQNEFDDTLAIAEILLTDEEDLIQKAVGGWLREVGRRDRPRLIEFLDKHAAMMPRTMLRYAVEHFDKDERAEYMAT